MLNAIKRAVNGSTVFQQDTASVHLAFNTVKLLQSDNVNFISPEP